MRAVVQRVTFSSVTVDGVEVSKIAHGLNVLLGVVKGDDEAALEKALHKLLHLRMFADDSGKMNRSLIDVGGAMLVVSQFTLGASIKKGRRPSFDRAAEPSEAKRLYEYFVTRAREHVKVSTGEFGAKMEVRIDNDGPVTFIVDSDEL